MKLGTSPTTQFRRSAPPSLRLNQDAPKPDSHNEMVLAARPTGRRHGKKIVAAAVGLGLAGLALTQCTSGPVPPAADPGGYELDNPEVVVLSNSTERIDLQREQKCKDDSFPAKDCELVDVEYHPIAIHLGEGIVEDLNGNLFAAPQLVAKGAPGAAVANPDLVIIEGAEYAEGRLERTGPSSYRISGNLFQFIQNLQTSPNEVLMTEPGMLGEFEMIQVTHQNGATLIKEEGFKKALVQSQGDHILVQTPEGEAVARIRHDENSGHYQVRHPGLFTGSTTEITYNDQMLQRLENGSVTARVERESDEDLTANSGERGVSTTVEVDGWNDNFGPGENIYVHYQGGEARP